MELVASPETRRSRTKAVRTRASILAAAERVFADKGYAAARLEDIATEVGIRRASLLYHVRDKRDLYERVLGAVFADLHARYRRALDAPGATRDKIDAIIEAWIGFVGERPTVARLLLWEAADCSRERTAVATAEGAAIVAQIADVIGDGQRHGCFRAIDPIHFLVTLMGATVFFVTATSRLVPAWPFDPLSPVQLAAHRAELLDIAHRLLGTSAPMGAEEAGAWI